MSGDLVDYLVGFFALIGFLVVVGLVILTAACYLFDVSDPFDDLR